MPHGVIRKLWITRGQVCRPTSRPTQRTLDGSNGSNGSQGRQFVGFALHGHSVGIVAGITNALGSFALAFGPAFGEVLPAPFDEAVAAGVLVVTGAAPHPIDDATAIEIVASAALDRARAMIVG